MHHGDDGNWNGDRDEDEDEDEDEDKDEDEDEDEIAFRQVLMIVMKTLIMRV